MKRLTIGIAAAALVSVSAVVGVPAVQAQQTEWPTLQSGDSGIDVQAVQHLAGEHGFETGTDGQFGPDTEAQVSAFQAANELDESGVVDAGTWEALVVDVQSGDEGAAAAGAQALLNKYGSGLATDGVFGDLTSEAVSAFQAAHDLEESGVVNADTWRELAGGQGVEYVLPVPKDVLPREAYAAPHHDYPASDLPVFTGTDVFATNGGTASVVDDSSCGRGVAVQGDDGARYVYCHFDDWSVNDGQQVEAGQQIGDSGNTGNSTGPHLHFAIDGTDGTQRCPQELMLAIYDGADLPSPDDLPTSGCTN